jgi:methyltransferase family protein
VNCCSPSGYRKVFGERVARRDAIRYRRKGLPAPARWIVETVVGRGVKDADVLEVGGGVGAIQLELLKAGASHTVNVEFSPGYEEPAAELVGEAGLSGRIERAIGDFTQDGPFDDADVVVMHRVVCCYPDYERLIAEAASRARRTLVFSYPPRNLVFRLINGGSNLWMRLRRNSFRSYVHSPDRMIDAARRQGLEPVASRRGGFWRAVALARD